MSDTIEVLQARVRELEAQLVVAAQEHRSALAAIAIADAELSALEKYLAPATAREAIIGALAIAAPESPLTYCDAADPTWRHITPAYKVGEVVESALRTLRGAA